MSIRVGSIGVGRSLLAVVFVATLAFGGCNRNSAASDEQSSQAPSTAEEIAVPVKAADVVDIKVPRTLRLTGNLRGAKETDLAANVSGMLNATFVERGQTVKEGEVIARVDVRAATLALAEAKVQVENTLVQQSISSADCARYEQLKARGAVTALEYDQVMAKCKVAPISVEAASARQRMAAKNVGDGVIRAPFTGVVTERFVDVGEYVQPSSRVVSLAQVKDLKLEFSLPEQNFPQIHVGASVTFKVAAYPDASFTATVSHISGAVRNTRDVVVEALVAGGEQKLLPGMFAEVEVTVGEEQLPGVPSSAVFEKNGKKNVLVLVGDTLEQRVIQPGVSLAANVPVRKGVKVGERVVVADVTQLKNGQRIIDSNRQPAN
jgi:membrane fusion protein, multidrug efflux system